MVERRNNEEREMLGKLLRHFRDYLGHIKPPLQVEPVANWRMNWEDPDAETQARGDLWELICYYGDSLFPVRTSWYYGTQLEFGGASELARQIYVNRSFDPNEFYLLEQIISDGMTFVDIGANVGVYSLFASRKVGPNGRVIAFEPSRREMTTLLRNIDINRISNISTHSLAVGERNSKAVLSVADEKYNGHNTLGELSLKTTMPTLRFTTDRVNHYWCALNDGVTQIPIGVARNIELLIYSEQPFRFQVNEIRILPAEGVQGPWLLDEETERPIELNANLTERLSRMDARMIGQPSLELNDNLRLSGSNGSGVVFRGQLDGESEYLIELEGSGVLDESVESYPVDVVSVDEFFSDFDRTQIDVIKIDIEGGELGALLGATRTIDKYQPLLIVEIVNNLLEESTLQDMHDFFVDKNYVLFDVLTAKPRYIDLRGEHASNVIAVPQRLLSRVLEIGELQQVDSEPDDTNKE